MFQTGVDVGGFAMEFQSEGLCKRVDLLSTCVLLQGHAEFEPLWYTDVLEPWLGSTYFLFCLRFPYMDSLIVCPN